MLVQPGDWWHGTTLLAYLDRRSHGAHAIAHTRAAFSIGAEATAVYELHGQKLMTRQ